MKIIIVAPIHKELEYIKQKGNMPFLYGQGQQSWHDALVSLGHRVYTFRYSDTYLIPNITRIYISTFFQHFFPVWKSRFNRYSEKLHLFFFDDYFKNRIFIKICEKVRPDLILVSGGLHGISPRTLTYVKNMYNSKAILLSGVNPDYGASEYDKELVRINFFEYIFTNDKGYCKNWEKIGNCDPRVLPISSCDLKIHKKYNLTLKERNNYACDICFIGSLSMDRQNVLLSLINFDLKIWGDIPPGSILLDKLKKNYMGKAQGVKMVKIYNAAKIVLNIHAKDMKYGGNMKTFEIPACGAFQMIDNINSSWFKDKKEIVVYNEVEDLKKKIKFYLKHEHERNKIAKAGFSRALRDHTYKEHFNKIFKVLYDEGKQVSDL